MSKLKINTKHLNGRQIVLTHILFGCRAEAQAVALRDRDALRLQGEWGAAVYLDGPQAEQVRQACLTYLASDGEQSDFEKALAEVAQ